MDGQTYYTSTQGIWNGDMQTHAMWTIKGHKNEPQKAMQTTGQTEI